jgi:hypothetical protein
MTALVVVTTVTRHSLGERSAVTPTFRLRWNGYDRRPGARRSRSLGLGVGTCRLSFRAMDVNQSEGGCSR